MSLEAKIDTAIGTGSAVIGGWYAQKFGDMAFIIITSAVSAIVGVIATHITRYYINKWFPKK